MTVNEWQFIVQRGCYQIFHMNLTIPSLMSHASAQCSCDLATPSKGYYA